MSIVEDKISQHVVTNNARQFPSAIKKKKYMRTYLHFPFPVFMSRKNMEPLKAFVRFKK